MNSFFSGFQPKFAFSLCLTVRTAGPSRGSVDSPLEGAWGKAVGVWSAPSGVGVSEGCPEKEHVVTEAPQRSGGHQIVFLTETLRDQLRGMAGGRDGRAGSQNLLHSDLWALLPPCSSFPLSASLGSREIPAGAPVAET